MIADAATLARLRAGFAATFVDRCRVLAYGETTDTMGGTVTDFTAGAEVACLFTMTASSVRHGAEYAQAEADARLRLAHDAVVTRNDRVQVTRRFGRLLAQPLTYAVAAEPRRNLGYTLCDLVEVTS